jgi:hypothetical protein
MKARKPVSRLVSPSILSQLSRPLLRRLLAPHIKFLEAHGVQLPPEQKKRKDYDFTALAKALLDADDRPPALLHALEAIGKMSDIHGAELLSRDIRLTPEAASAIRLRRAAPADLALYAFLDHRAIFDQALLEKQVVDTRRYKCFVPGARFDFSEARFTQAAFSAIEREIGHSLGDEEEGCQIIPSSATPNARWFIIMHGGRTQRLGIWRGKSDRPRIDVELENDHVVRFNMATGEMWIHAKVKSEFEAYRKSFGRHLLGSEDAFGSATRIYNLQALRTRGQAAMRVDDLPDCPIESIRLLYVEVLADTTNRLAYRLSCKNDLYRCLDASGSFIPNGLIVAARFEVRFRGSRKRTTVKVNLPASADYERDSDAEWIDAWLKKRFSAAAQPG